MRLNLLRRPKPEQKLTTFVLEERGLLIDGQHRLGAVLDEPEQPGELGGAEKLQNTVLGGLGGDAFTLPPKIPVFGKYIHGRFAQMLAWSLVIGALGVGLPAGVYFLVLQVHWFIHAGPLYWKGVSLKLWWDSGMGFLHSKNWPLYRHAAFRDNLEPSVFIMAIATLLAKPKTWSTRIGLPRLIATPFLLVALAIGMGLAGVWLLDFQFPHYWHDLFGSYHVPMGFAANLSIGTLLWAFLMARVLHWVWGPAGATIQGYLMDRSVDMAKTANKIPNWVRYPDVPPVIRERFSWIWDHDAEVTERKKLGKWSRFFLKVFVVVAFLVMIVGLIAKYWIAKGHHVPYLAP